MKILYTSDIHTDPNHLDRLLAAAGNLQVDAVIIGGDLIPVWEWTLSASIETQRRWIRDVLFPRLAIFLRKSPSTSFFLDFGNDDLMANRPLLEERAGKYFTLIDRQIAALNANLALVGYMFVRPTPFKLKDWEKVDCAHRTGLEDDVLESGVRTETGVEGPYRLKLSDGTMEDDLAQLTELLEKPAWQERDFLFVSHCPPVNSALDILSDGRHVGSLAIRHFIEHWGSNGRLRASFHGHIHESPWMSKRVCDRITGVPCFNAGQEAGQLRALFFNARDIENSTHLVKVGNDEQLYKVSISELSIHP